MEPDSLHLIQTRLREIAREEERLSARLKDLQAEREELSVTQRVLARLHGPAGNPAGDTGAASPATDGGGKPEGTPSIGDMILAVLADAQKDGIKGMEPVDLAREIEIRWWPNARRDTIGSIAWRLWKRRDLEKNGSLYSLPKKIETPGNLFAEEPGASDVKPISRPVEPVPGGGT